MNKFFKGRNLIIGLVTLALGLIVAVGIGKISSAQSSTVTGKINAFTLNPEGKVDGAILDTGDQIKFGPETGAEVTASVGIGGTLTATGNAGTGSNYGREFHAQSLQIGDKTITIAHKPKAKDGKREGGRHDGEKGKRRGGKDRERGGENADKSEDAAPDADRPQAETAQISGTVKYVLVNREGNPRGVILAGGEQLNLGREVEKAGPAFDENTNIAAQGEIVKSEFGTFVKADTLTIGNQTFTFNR